MVAGSSKEVLKRTVEDRSALRKSTINVAPKTCCTIDKSVDNRPTVTKDCVTVMERLGKV